MSKPLHHDDDLFHVVRNHERAAKRHPHGHNLCNQPPAAPTGVSITWDRVEQQRHGVTRGIVTWDEVTKDVDGFDISNKNISHYVIQFVKSDDGSTSDAHVRRFVVAAKDTDADTTAEKVVHNVHKHYFYRARVRAVDTNHLRGDWSAWTSWQHPNPANNAAIPTNVTKIEAAQRVGLNWDPAGTFDSTTNLPDLSVSHYEVQVSKSSGFGTLVAHQKHHVSDHYRYVVPDVDDGVTHYLRVRSVSHDGDVSAWQPSDAGIAANNTSVGGVASLPPGTIIHHATAAPTTWAAAHGFLRCNGDSYATSTYPDLFAEIGYTYGGSGANFNVPDSKGRHLIGPSVNFAIGANEGAAEADRSAAHVHGNDNTDTSPGTDGTSTSVTNDGTGQVPSSDSTGEAGHVHSISGDTSVPHSGSPGGTGGSGVYGSGHTHNLGGWTSQPGSNHGHGHTHGSHGHDHAHGLHGHAHNHGPHHHLHQHDNKTRPHVAIHMFIKV